MLLCKQLTPLTMLGGQVFNTRQVACWQLEVASGRPCIVCVVVERSTPPPQENGAASPAPGELKPFAGPLRTAGSSASSQLLGSRLSELATQTSPGKGSPHAVGGGSGHAAVHQSGLPLHGKLSSGAGALATGTAAPSAGPPFSAGSPAREGALPGGQASAGEPPGFPPALVNGQASRAGAPPAQGAGRAGAAGGHATTPATAVSGREPADGVSAASEAATALAAPSMVPGAAPLAGPNGGP